MSLLISMAFYRDGEKGWGDLALYLHNNSHEQVQLQLISNDKVGYQCPAPVPLNYHLYNFIIVPTY